MKRASLVLAGLLLLGHGCKRESPSSAADATRPPSELPAPPGEPPLAALDAPETCGACHAEVLKEWSTSLHASAHHTKDEIYRGVRSMRMKREGEGIASGCAQCHSPRSQGSPEGKLAELGVSCTGCHLVSAVQMGPGRFGAKAFTYATDGAMRGVRGPSTRESIHGFAEPAPHLTDGKTLCLACHDELKNAEGIPICTTGVEHRELSGAQTCVDCHMPTLDGPSGSANPERTQHRSHAFLGPHRALRDGDIDFLKTALHVEARFEAERLVVQLENKSGHALPTGFPARMMVVQVLGHDRDEQVVYSSFKENPMQETPDAVFGKVYVDEAGKPTLAPWSKKLERDSRLRPGETRVLSMVVPPSVQRATVKVFFRLLAPPLARQLELDSKPIGGGKVIALSVVSRTPTDVGGKPKGKAKTRGAKKR